MTLADMARARSYGCPARQSASAAGGRKLIPGSRWWAVVRYELRADLFKNGYGFVGVGARCLVESVLSERDHQRDGDPLRRQVRLEAGFTCFRRAAETPFNLVYKIRP